MEKGFKRVRPLEGGLDGWVAAGYEVEGSAPARTSTLPTIQAV